MSVRPLDIASQEELERGTLPTKPRSDCRTDFAGTVLSVIASVAILLWVLFSVLHLVKTVSVPYCEGLLTDDSIVGALLAMFFIFGLFSVQLKCTFKLGNRVGTIGIFVVVCAGISVVSGFPYLGGETTFGLFHSSSPTPIVHNSNRSEYWNESIRICVCKTEACEDMVYRDYFGEFYGITAVRGLGFSGKKKWDEVKRLGPLEQDLNGTSLNNGDRYSPYHVVCYSNSSGDKGKKTVCYDCYGCEEKYLREQLISRWKFGNKLFVLSLLLIVSNIIMFLAESWRRFME